MASVEEELEEGEISDSDSMGGEEQKSQMAGKPQTQQYSLFGDLPRAAPTPASVRPTSRLPRSDTDSSSSQDEDDDYGDVNSFQEQSRQHNDKKRSRRHSDSSSGNVHSKPFINPNFVNNGRVMPPMPTNKNVWGSVLQEQILSDEVGGFSMEKKVVSDRDVEAYDYTRAKDDDRPHLALDPVKGTEDDLFGEVIDLEKSAVHQKKTLKRKHVSDRLGRRKTAKERLRLPEVTDRSSVDEVAYYISTMLEEKKVHLIKRVVKTVRQAKALDLYHKTLKVEENGGMLTMNQARRRTKGGVYLMLLKEDKDVTKEQLDEIFEEENRNMMELKNDRAARRKKRKQAVRQMKRAEQAASGTKAGTTSSDNNNAMDVVSAAMAEDDAQSCSSVDGQRGSPRNHADHLSDSPAARNPAGDCDSSHDDSDLDKGEGDFQDQLKYELKRQAKDGEEKGGGAEGGDRGDHNAVTLDDVLDIGVEEDFID